MNQHYIYAKDMHTFQQQKQDIHSEDQSRPPVAKLKLLSYCCEGVLPNTQHMTATTTVKTRKLNHLSLLISSSL